VDVDDASAARYRALPGALGDRLRQVLRDTEDGTVMTTQNGRCPMWRQDGLCQIQAQLGHDALCEVCRQFPRLCHDYGDFAQLGLELSCPEAARLILSPEMQAIICEEQPGGEQPDYDGEVMEVLRASQEKLLQFWQDTVYSIPQALAITLLYAHAVQSQIDGSAEAELLPEKSLLLAKKFAKGGDIAAVLDFFKQLEILTPDWKARLKTPAQPGEWTARYRLLVRYFINRYWLQAVSDYDLISRVKLTVVACLLIHALGGDMIQTAQQFSKEIENDPDNIEAILDGAYTAPAFTDAALLGLLLQ